MSVGTAIRNLFVKISSDISGLVSGNKQAVDDTRRAVQQMMNDWDRLGKRIRDTGAPSSRVFRDSIPHVDRFGRSIGGARQQVINLGAQINDLGVQIASGGSPLIAMIQQGAQIQTIYGGRGGIRAAFSDLFGVLSRLKIVGGVLGGLVLGLHQMTSAIDSTTTEAVTMGDTFLAVFSVAGDAIWDIIGGPLTALGKAMSDVMGVILSVVKTALNTIIGGWHGAYKSIVATWNQFPAAIGDLVISAVNSVLTGIDSMIEKARGGIADFINGVNLSLAQIPEAIRPPPIPIPNPIESIGRLKNQYAGAASALADTYKETFEETLGRDYIGEVFGAISDRAVQFARNRRLAAEKDKNEDGSGKTAKVPKSRAHLERSLYDPFEKVTTDIEGLFDRTFQRILDRGRFSFKDFAKDIGGMLVSELSNAAKVGVKALISQLVGASSALSKHASGQGLFGTIFSALGAGLGGVFGFGGAASLTAQQSVSGLNTALSLNTVSGLFADGGGVQAGKSYVVGERGPEIFRSGVAGRIVSNRDSEVADQGGGGDIKITLIDPTGDRGIRMMVQEGVRAGLQQYDRNVGKRVIMQHRRFST